MFKKKKTLIEENKVRVIKISRDALFEFIYENIIDEHDYLLDAPAVGSHNTFSMDWETGEFIFCAHRSEDKNGNLLELPEEIDLCRLMHNMPDTTDSMYSGKKYEEFTMEELAALSKKQS